MLTTVDLPINLDLAVTPVDLSAVDMASPPPADDRVLWVDLRGDTSPDLERVRALAMHAYVMVLVSALPLAAWWAVHSPAAINVKYVHGRLRDHDGQWLQWPSAVMTFAPQGCPDRHPGPTVLKPTHARQCDVDAAIAGYFSHLLPLETFILVEPAIKRLVSSVRPASPARARAYLYALVVFLSGPIDWDRKSVPDLGALLNRDSIITATNRQVIQPQSRTAIRENLRAISRQAGLFADRAVAPHIPYPDRFLAAGVTRPFPAPTLVAAYNQRSGSTLRWPLGRTIAALKQAQPHPGGQLEREVTPAAAHALTTCVTPTTTMPATPASQQSKRMSRKERLARTRQADMLSVALREQALHPTVPDVDTTQMDPTVVAKSSTYTPSVPECLDAWQANEAVAYRLLLGIKAPNVKAVGSYGGQLARFIAWFHTWDGRSGSADNTPITYEELLTAGVCEAYGIYGTHSPASAATYRSTARRAIESLIAHRATSTARDRSGAAPYTAEDLRRLVFLAENQGTPARRSLLCGVIALGAGAGLSAKDLRHLTPAHIATRQMKATAVTFVTVPHDGRVVPVRKDLVPLLNLALKSHTERGKEPTDLLFGTEPKRNNAIGHLLAKVPTLLGDPIDADQNRLRNTWIVAAMCARVSVADVLRAAGLTTSRTLESLLPYCPTPDQASVDEVLAALHDIPTGTGHLPNRGGKRGDTK